ncbi:MULTISPECIES: DUF2489 domain-containing protein [unclassified Neptuniibacter]|jgi:hypothetical protein|uniref:DUF2489 domain-containing protein n=1 Tax=unclassified Neptuniibacter TaxID=2630693 RepID=UPI0026E17A5A|nr:MULTISPECIES: DUF2489 domain-containing protein [unclassified Neptuniibacter]MDO6514463.1 DUF2489 domain-containing protein [Neptuniibacter sp. 2_MG-2023]MDO6594812.1 DUF2489 domain-containing protein [Neptuniibacter sp. 1_MG-2023]
MSEEYIYLLIILLSVICLFLIVFIRHKYQQIKAAQSAVKEQEEKVAERYEEQRAYLIESIKILARAYGNDERLTCTEACMRLCALLSSLSPPLLEKPELVVIREVHRKTEHIPIKDKWKALSKQERWGFSKEMAKVEAEHESDLLLAVEYLVNYDFNLIVN